MPIPFTGSLQSERGVAFPSPPRFVAPILQPVIGNFLTLVKLLMVKLRRGRNGSL